MKNYSTKGIYNIIGSAIYDGCLVLILALTYNNTCVTIEFLNGNTDGCIYLTELKNLKLF